MAVRRNVSMSWWTRLIDWHAKCPYRFQLWGERTVLPLALWLAERCPARLQSGRHAIGCLSFHCVTIGQQETLRWSQRVAFSEDENLVSLDVVQVIVHGEENLAESRGVSRYLRCYYLGMYGSGMGRLHQSSATYDLLLLNDVCSNHVLGVKSVFPSNL